MRMLKEGLIHGLAWAQGDATDPASKSLALSAPLHFRKLQTMNNGFGDNDAFNSLFAGMDQCVDLDELEAKAMDFDWPDEALDDPSNLSPQQQVDMVNQLVTMFAPGGGDVPCTSEQIEKVNAAFEAFDQCSGDKWDQENQATEEEMQDLITKLGDKCSAMNMILDPDGCTDVLFGDNPIGDMYRHVYHDIGIITGKICLCTPHLQDALPNCTITLKDIAEKMAIQSQEDFDPVYLDMKIPLGAVKTLTCMLSSMCDGLTNGLDEMCVEELGYLDTCLSSMGNKACGSSLQNDPSCEASLFFSVPPGLAQGKLPDVCLAAYNNHNMDSGVPERYSSYFNLCYPGYDFSPPEENNVTGSTKENSPSSSPWHIFIIIIIVVVAVLTVVISKLIRHTYQPMNQMEASGQYSAYEEETHEKMSAGLV